MSPVLKVFLCWSPDEDVDEPNGKRVEAESDEDAAEKYAEELAEGDAPGDFNARVYVRQIFDDGARAPSFAVFDVDIEWESSAFSRRVKENS